MTKSQGALLRAAGAARPYGGHGSFNDRLAAGIAGEELVARWLRARGWSVVDLRELPPAGAFQGPHIVTPAGPVLTPDLLAIRGGEVKLVEVKLKLSAGWNRRVADWTTGISETDLARCVKAAEATGTPTWLVFLHTPPDASGEPAGLFGGDVRELAARVHHRHGQMEFWRLADLRLLATLGELRAAADGQPASRATQDAAEASHERP